jgi:hypothetical protein
MVCAKCGRSQGARAKRCFFCGTPAESLNVTPAAVPEPVPEEHPAAAEIQGIFISLTVGFRPSLFVLLAADGTVNRMGSGGLNNTDLEMYIGRTPDPLFATLRKWIKPEWFEYPGEYKIPDGKGLPCELQVHLKLLDGRQTGLVFHYGSQSKGPPAYLCEFVERAAAITAPWHQSQKALAALPRTAGILDQCSRNWGTPPRTIAESDAAYLRIDPPVWLSKHPEEELSALFQGLPQLLSEGRVVWGHVVQANGMLFRSDMFNYPAEFVFTLAGFPDVDTHELQRVARSIFALKKTTPDDPELARIATYLKSEVTRVFGLPVPREVSPQLDCLISTTYVVRKHLPSRKLSCPLVPLIVSPSAPHFVIPLPSKFWPEEFAKAWSKGGL